MYKKTLRLSPMSSCIAIILNTFTVYIKMLHVFSNKLGDYISEWKMFFENETKWVQIFHNLGNIKFRMKAVGLYTKSYDT